MDDITTAIAQDYFAQKKLKPSSYNRYLTELSVVWKRINIRSGKADNPFQSISKIEKSIVTKETTHTRPFSPEELKIISEKATDWIKFAVIIGYYPKFPKKCNYVDKLSPNALIMCR